MITETMTQEQFLGQFGPMLMQSAHTVMAPQWTPGAFPDVAATLDALPLLRRPLPGQNEAIQAASVHFIENRRKTLFLSMEMGTGKTFTALASAALVSAREGTTPRVIVVCPPHMIQKWAREIHETIPGAVVKKANHGAAGTEMIRAARKNPGAPSAPEYWIVGRARLRMRTHRRSATTIRRVRGTKEALFHACPDCGEVVMAKSSPVSAGTNPPERCEWTLKQPRPGYDESSRVVRGCGAPLWEQRSVKADLAVALKLLPGYTRSWPRRFRDHPEWVAMMENGEIPADLAAQLPPGTQSELQARLDAGWGADTTAFGITDAIKRIPRYWFEYAIFDELHELSGETWQGEAFGIVAGRARRNMGLTGTLVNGYAAPLHPLLFRADPNRMRELGYGYRDKSKFQSACGVYAHRTRIVAGRQSRSTVPMPGLNPSVISDLLLPNSVFLEMPDIEKGIQKLLEKSGAKANLLPSYREVFVKLPMTDGQRRVETEFLERLRALKQDTGNGADWNHRHKQLVQAVMYRLLYAYDECYRDITLNIVEGETVIAAATATMDLLPKEQFLVDLAKREVAAKRNILVATPYSGTLDLTQRYVEILRTHGIRAASLHASVSPEYREEALDKALRDGYNAVVLNPELIKTGLDLLGFPTLIFMQQSNMVDTLQQASRRSWRLGQTRPVRVYFCAYDCLPQMYAIQRLAKKVMVSQQARGTLAGMGLAETLDVSDENVSLLAMAKALLDGQRDRSRDAITGMITHITEDDLSAEFTATGMDHIHSMLSPGVATPPAAVVQDPPAQAVVRLPSWMAGSPTTGVAPQTSPHNPAPPPAVDTARNGSGRALPRWMQGCGPDPQTRDTKPAATESAVVTPSKKRQSGVARPRATDEQMWLFG